MEGVKHGRGGAVRTYHNMSEDITKAGNGAPRLLGPSPTLDRQTRGEGVLGSPLQGSCRVPRLAPSCDTAPRAPPFLQGSCQKPCSPRVAALPGTRCAMARGLQKRRASSTMRHGVTSPLTAGSPCASRAGAFLSPVPPLRGIATVCHIHARNTAW